MNEGNHTDKPAPNRRQALQMLAGAVVLPYTLGSAAKGSSVVQRAVAHAGTVPAIPDISQNVRIMEWLDVLKSIETHQTETRQLSRSLLTTEPLNDIEVRAIIIDLARRPQQTTALAAELKRVGRNLCIHPPSAEVIREQIVHATQHGALVFDTGAGMEATIDGVCEKARLSVPSMEAVTRRVSAQLALETRDLIRTASENASIRAMVERPRTPANRKTPDKNYPAFGTAKLPINAGEYDEAALHYYGDYEPVVESPLPSAKFVSLLKQAAPHAHSIRGGAYSPNSAEPMAAKPLRVEWAERVHPQPVAELPDAKPQR